MAGYVRFHYRVFDLQSVLEGAVELLELDQERTDILADAGLAHRILPYFNLNRIPNKKTGYKGERGQSFIPTSCD